jgi:hypothetical protein
MNKRPHRTLEYDFDLALLKSARKPPPGRTLKAEHQLRGLC